MTRTLFTTLLGAFTACALALPVAAQTREEAKADAIIGVHCASPCRREFARG